MSTYKLYATKTGEIPECVEFSLRPYNVNYLLVFTDKELKKPFVEIPPETELTEQEQGFVAESMAIVNKRFIDEHKDEYWGFLNDFNDSLDKAIKEAKKKAKPKKKTEDEAVCLRGLKEYAEKHAGQK